VIGGLRRSFVAAVGSAQEPPHRLVATLLHAPALEVQVTEITLGLGVDLLGRQDVPACRPVSALKPDANPETSPCVPLRSRLVQPAKGLALALCH
jgi:hypothetical protein